MIQINCLLIDDEPASISVLKTFINKIDFLHISGVCNNAIEAASFLQKNSTVNLLFLDINMPSISGLDFYKSLVHKPLLIFTTAHPQFALEAFDVNAIDYLLKPFSFHRFLTAVNKVVEKMVSTSHSFQQYVFIKSTKKLHKIAVADIYYIEAYGDYVKVYLEDTVIITYSKFASFLALLPSSYFFKIHRSFAVNLHKIKYIEGNQVGVHNSRIPIGSSFKSKFLSKFKH